METKFTSAYRPGSGYELVHAKSVHHAMASEELSRVHPIRPVLETEGDIFGFDYGIVYWKGGAVIAMFEQFLGPERFRAGIRQYLAEHRDGNATRDDLMGALSAQGADVGPALRSFVEQPGLPLLHAELRCEGGSPRVALRQSRQLPLGSPAQPGGQWEVPVCVRTSETRERPDCVLLRTEQAELPLTRKTCPAWFALNPGGRGYYRWTLPARSSRVFLKKGYASLRPAERLSLASNLTAAFRSGALSAEEVLAALESFARDPEPAVAQEPAEFLQLIQDRYVDPAQRPRVRAYLRSLDAPVLTRIGRHSRPGEPERVRIFRPWLIDTLAFSRGLRGAHPGLGAGQGVPRGGLSTAPRGGGRKPGGGGPPGGGPARLSPAVRDDAPATVGRGRLERPPGTPRRALAVHRAGPGGASQGAVASTTGSGSTSAWRCCADRLPSPTFCPPRGPG